MEEAIVYLYDNKCEFYPVTEKLKKQLTVWTNVRINANESTRRPEPCYYIEVINGKPHGVTHQGFWKLIMDSYFEDGIVFEVVNRRIARTEMGFPEPALDKMYGFRFSQEELITSALIKNRSGLIGAPTRYGKSVLMVNTIRAYPTLTICVVAPGVDLVNQLYEDITVKFGIRNRTTHIIHGSKKLKKQIQKGDIVVCSIDSLSNVDPDEFDLLIADEPHAFGTARRVEFLERFHKARRLGFGATLHGRSDGRDKFIMGLFGPILAKRTYLEAVREGAICPLEVIFYDVELAPSSWKRRDTAYNKHFYKNETIANTIKRICHEVIPKDMQTLIFIKNEEQARMLQNTIGKDTCLAMAKTMTDSEREEKTALLKNNIIKRCLCTRIYVQGVTFSDVRFLVNAEAGGATTSSIQKPGRLAEIRPNKKCGIIIDLFFKPIPGENLSDHQGEGWVSLCRESNSRKNMYKREGYNITHVSSIQELKQVVNNKL